MKRFATTAFLFGMLVGIPGAHAACRTLDCTNDPQAWADAFGHSPSQLAEQRAARQAAANEVARRKQEVASNDAKAQSINDMPGYKKAIMIEHLEDAFLQITGTSYTIIAATVIPHEDEYLFCGAVVSNAGDGGVFAFDTASDGFKGVKINRVQFAAAGCNRPSVTLR